MSLDPFIFRSRVLERGQDQGPERGPNRLIMAEPHPYIKMKGQATQALFEEAQPIMEAGSPGASY